MASWSTFIFKSVVHLLVIDHNMKIIVDLLLEDQSASLFK